MGMTRDPFRVLAALCLLSAAVTLTSAYWIARWMLG